MPAPVRHETPSAGWPPMAAGTGAREKIGLVQHRQRVLAQQREALGIGLGPKRAIEDHQREVGAGCAGEGAAHAFALNLILALAQSRGVGEGDRPTAKIEAHLDHVAGGAGTGRNDGRVPPG